MAIIKHAYEQTDDSQCHETDYHQLDVSHPCLFLLGLKNIDVVLHILHVKFQGFALA